MNCFFSIIRVVVYIFAKKRLDSQEVEDNRLLICRGIVPIVGPNPTPNAPRRGSQTKLKDVHMSC